MPLNIPNLLTWSRIALIPVFIAVLFLSFDKVLGIDRDLLAALIFIVAATTDWLDGYLARALKQSSAFGAFLDPVADKLMVAAALIILTSLGRADPIAAIIIIGREITISALREWMALFGERGSVAVAMVGKIKTAAQMTAIPLLVYGKPLFGVDCQVAGTWLLWIAAVLTIWSMFYYLRKAAPKFRDSQ